MSSQIEDVKARLDIADILGSYLKLQKAGVNFKARCPFHNERTASFFVSPARQIWHCFGCQKGGDVFKFVMEIEGYEFKDALRVLAERAGVELKRESPEVQDAKSKQLVILEEATKFFENQLAGDALLYLKQRGLSVEIIKEFRLGYALDDWRILFNHLSAKGFRVQDIESAGLIIKSENNYYDRFRGRIMFPIFNQSGKVIAFGGRIFPDKPDAAKYVNSPETTLYQKSKILYGLHKSKIEILRENSCVLVEGYMDMLMSYQSGIKNVVAVSGTALTVEHIKIIQRISETLKLAFDLDSAGNEAGKRGIYLLKSLIDQFGESFDKGIEVVKLEGFKDAAEVVKQNSEIWKEAVENSIHVVKFYIDTALSKFKPDSVMAVQEFDKSVMPVVASLKSLEQAYWVKEISAILNIKEEAVWNALGKIQNSKHEIRNNEDKIPNTSKPQTRKDLLENRVLGIAAKYPELLARQSSSIEPSLFSGEKQTAFAEIRNGSSGGFKDFISRLVLEAELFLEALPAGRQGVESAETEFIKCARELNKEHLKEKMNLLFVKINYAEKNKKDELPNLLLEFKNLSDKINKI